MLLRKRVGRTQKYPKERDVAKIVVLETLKEAVDLF